MLVRAGARRSDGTLITADQIRVGYTRLSKSKGKDRRPQSEPPESSDKKVRAAKGGNQPQAKSRARAEPLLAPSDGHTAQGQFAGDDDVSNDEISLALARLSKL